MMKPPDRLLVIAVCGAGKVDDATADLARQTGKALAEAGAALLCGGRGGVMAAAARGAKEAGGLTIGLLPGVDWSEANEFIDLALPTGLGEARNAVIVRAARAVIALPGGAGTLSEVALALKMGRPVIGLNAWADIPGVIAESDPARAARRAAELARKK